MSDGALRFLGEFQDALPSIHPVFVQYFYNLFFLIVTFPLVKIAGFFKISVVVNGRATGVLL